MSAVARLHIWIMYFQQFVIRCNIIGFRLDGAPSSVTPNVKCLLTHCTDVYTRYRLAYQQKLYDVTKTLLEDPKTASYLNDRLSVWVTDWAATCWWCNLWERFRSTFENFFVRILKLKTIFWGKIARTPVTFSYFHTDPNIFPQQILNLLPLYIHITNLKRKRFLF